MIKSESRQSGPKQVVERISSSMGGMLSATDMCQLPRSEQQVSQAKRRCKRQIDSKYVSNPDDELAIVLQKAFMEDSSKQFIREIRTLREPAIVVCRDQQVADLVRFCTGEEFCIMTVDPTFSLGEFDVTVTTYRHLLLECRRTGSPPVFIGPTMIHYKKTFSTYLFFASTLVGLQPELSQLRSFGTDGEEALYKAFQHEFPTSIHLQCFNHVRRNVKAKLQELAISDCTAQVILGDIFGKMVEFQHFDGLVDADSDEEYEEGLQSLCQKWEGYDDDPKGPLHSFCRWLKCYKSDTIQDTMLRSKRRQAGLGDLPMAFTTNASESINALLKIQVQHKKSDVPLFLEKLKAAIDEQQREVERAIIDKGKYKFKEAFENLVKSENEWFLKMSTIQKQNHINRVGKVLLQSKKATKNKVKKLTISTCMSGVPSTSKTMNQHKSTSLQQPFTVKSGAPSEFAQVKKCSISQQPFNTKSKFPYKTFQQPFSTQLEVASPNDVAQFRQSSAKRQLFYNIPSASSRVSEVQGASRQQLCGAQSGASSMSDRVDTSQHSHLGFPSTSSTPEEITLSVPVNSFCRQVVVQEHILEAIWRKAAELLKEDRSIVEAPGGTGFLVKSNSRPRPHHVTLKKSGQYCCDSECPNWQSLCICSHSVATAEKEGDLEPFVEWYKKSKKVPNLTKLITAKMPKGRGRKGGAAPPKKKPKVTISSTDRVPFSTVCNLSHGPKEAVTLADSSRCEYADDMSYGDVPAYEFPDDGCSSQTFSSGMPSLSLLSRPQEQITHTLTVSSGSSSHAFAGDRFLSHSLSLPSGSATSEGFISQCNSLPSAPPPLIPCTTSPINTSPFTLAFIGGNIRVCRGCRQKFVKPPLPPNNLCVRHQEWQEFTPAGSSCCQRRFGNVYYHCNLACVVSRCPGFTPTMLVIPPTILVQLLPVHTTFIQMHMPGRLASP